MLFKKMFMKKKKEPTRREAIYPIVIDQFTPFHKDKTNKNWYSIQCSGSEGSEEPWCHSHIDRFAQEL